MSIRLDFAFFARYAETLSDGTLSAMGISFDTIEFDEFPRLMSEFSAVLCFSWPVQEIPAPGSTMFSFRFVSPTGTPLVPEDVYKPVELNVPSAVASKIIADRAKTIMIMRFGMLPIAMPGRHSFIPAVDGAEFEPIHFWVKVSE